MEKHKVCCQYKRNKPFISNKSRMVYFYCLYCKYKMIITKAKFMIVTPTNPKKSSLTNNIKANFTIALSPLSVSQLKFA